MLAYYWGVDFLTREEIYSGVKGAMFLYGGLFKRLIEAVGIDGALATHVKLQEPFGEGWAELLRDKLGGNELNMKIFSDVYVSMSNSGVQNVYEITSNSFSVLGYQCPIYDGLRDAGIDHNTIKCMCMGASELIFKEFRKYYPNVEAGAVFRDNPESYCVEWYNLKKITSV